MKKIYPLCLLLSLFGICSYVLSSCSDDDTGASPKKEVPENTLAYGDVESKIQSVIYTVDENKVYTFYFSPTGGIVDLEAMLLADDYLKIVTSTPTGEVDLLTANNMLRYGDVEVSRATGDEVAKASLSLQLTSLFTAKMSLEVVLQTGQTLRAEFHEMCTRLSQDDAPEEGYDLVLTQKIFAYYMGPEKKAGTNGYYFAVTNAKFIAAGTQFQLEEEGYALLLSVSADPGADWKELPTGTFLESDTFSDHTYYNKYSFVYYMDANKKTSIFQLLDPVKIEMDGAGVATVTATFLDQNRKERSLIYEGLLPLSNATLNIYMPQVGRDMVFVGYDGEAYGTYSGDVADKGTGLVELTIFDETGANNLPNGSAMHLALFGKKFDNPEKERGLTPGTYTAGTDGSLFTWQPAQEMVIPALGMVIPMGTFLLYDDGTQDGQYAYAVSGEIEVTEAVNHNYTINFDLVSIEGYSIRGTFSGQVYLEDSSHDEKNDGSTTLMDNYEMDLDYVSRAEFYQRDAIRVPSLGGDIPLETLWERYSESEYDYQYMTLGGVTYEPSAEYPLKGKLLETDLFAVELLVERGKGGTIVPGYYEVTPNRFPIRFKPGACIRGYIGGAPIDGTTFKGVRGVYGWGSPDGYYDPDYKVQNGWLNIPSVSEYAAIYSGSIIVSKAEGGDNWFTFDVRGQDVLGHNVTGKWTGPVYLAGTDTPVLQGAAAPKSVAGESPRKGALGNIRTFGELERMGARPQQTTIKPMTRE